MCSKLKISFIFIANQGGKKSLTMQNVVKDYFFTFSSPESNTLVLPLPE